MFDKIKKILKEFDFIWALPLGFLSFILYPVIGAQIWGDGFPTYSPEFFHAGIYAGLMIVLFNSFTQIGIYFNFPELYHYYLGEDFKQLPPWLRLLTFLTVYSFFFFALLTVWSKIV